jgi:D-3-phosphoglycerate dehydrogenase
MLKVLICDPIDQRGIDILQRAAEVTVHTGLKENELIEIVPDFDALMVRSQTKITAGVLQAATKLQIVGRAGVGVDNIDVAAATERGVIIVNSPGGNTVAVAELTLAMMLDLVRRILPADASVKRGEWKRSAFLGKQLWGKTLGVLGVGRIGAEVIRRAQSFDMKILGYDPFLTDVRASQLGIEAASIDEILARADFVTIHTPLTKETKNMINAEAIAGMKDGAVIINCSRGGIIDESALYDALKSGKLAGAGLDVYQTEPPENSPLRELENVVLTPHIGASTEEAQVEVAVDVAEQIVDVLAGRPPQSAVNLPPLPPETREFLAPFLPLVEKLGKVHSQMCEGRIENVELRYCGELNEYDVAPLTRVFLKGLLQPSFDQAVTYVNAPQLAEARGVSISETKCDKTKGYASLIEARVNWNDDGRIRQRQIDGTIFNGRDPYIVGIQGLRVDVIPEGNLLVLFNTDKPGMIGVMGNVLGDAGVNIIAMHVGRKSVGERAVTVLTCEEPIPDAVLKQLDAHPDVFGARQVDLR